jgi:hypothetical protein
MKLLKIKSDQDYKYFVKLSIQLVILITATGIVDISTVDIGHENANAQTLQEKCNSDSGMNVSKSNCFSNAPSNPVYNATNTNNVRPPP